MNIINLGLGVVTKKLEIKIYSLSKPDQINDKKPSFEQDEIIKNVFKNESDNDSIKKKLIDNIDNIDLDVSTYKPFSNKALVNEDNFYIDLSALTNKDEFYYIKRDLVKDNLIGQSKQIGLSKKDFQALEKRKENIRFIILEEGSRYLLLYLSPYKNIIKNKHGFTVGSKATKFDIDYGIIYPEYITAILDKNNWRLSIADVANFEKMFNLKIVRLAKATEVFEKFKKGAFTLGKDKLKVKFDDGINLKLKKYNKTRQITYISSYNPKDAQYSTKNIENAMKLLPADNRLKIKNNTIQVMNDIQFKTFTAILHDSILERMLSGKYVIL